ncbi:MAG: glycosyl transferase [Flammeovirgaceae bacterium]|nr:glycosyl transferase [Flammeovirgaceae bacterium]
MISIKALARTNVDIVVQAILNNQGDYQFKKGLTSFVNPYSLMVLAEKSDIIRKIDYWYVDGGVLVLLLNKLFKSKLKRYSFDDTSLAPIVFDYSKKNYLNVAIVGAKPEEVKLAIDNIERKYGKLVTLFRDGYFNSANNQDNFVKEIINKNIDIVICGMGTPLQEKFLIELKNKGWQGFGFTCGGFIHQSSTNVSYYPKLINKLKLRWVYRMIKEPNTIVRYVVVYPICLIKLMVYRLKH